MKFQRQESLFLTPIFSQNSLQEKEQKKSHQKSLTLLPDQKLMSRKNLSLASFTVVTTQNGFKAYYKVH